MPNAKTMALYETAKGIAGAGSGSSCRIKSSGGGSDGNFTGPMDVATLDGLGVRGNGAHTLDEHIIVDSLVERAKLFTGLLMELS